MVQPVIRLYLWGQTDGLIGRIESDQPLIEGFIPQWRQADDITGIQPILGRVCPRNDVRGNEQWPRTNTRHSTLIAVV